MIQVGTSLFVITLNINRLKSPIKIQILVEWNKAKTMIQSNDAYNRLTLDQKIKRMKGKGWKRYYIEIVIKKELG